MHLRSCSSLALRWFTEVHSRTEWPRISSRLAFREAHVLVVCVKDEPVAVKDHEPGARGLNEGAVLLLALAQGVLVASLRSVRSRNVQTRPR